MRIPGDPATACPVLFKGSRSLLLLACCYVTYRWSYAYLYRRYLVVWQPCCTSRTGTALFVRLNVCGSIYVYRCRALLVIGCTCFYAYNLAKCYIMAMLNMIDDMFMYDKFPKYPVKMKFQHKTAIPQRR